MPAGIRSRANGFVKIAVSLTIAVSAVISLLVVDRSLKLAFAIPTELSIDTHRTTPDQAARVVLDHLRDRHPTRVKEATSA